MTESAPPHSYLAHGGPIAFAHRGGIESGTENTLAAFADAVGVGFTYLETDVHLTADGVVVAAHDERLDRVADVNGTIAQMPWSEVAVARIGGSEPIPTFEELLVEFPDVRFNVDPKSDAVLDPLLDLLERHEALPRVCIGAFSDARLARARSRFGRMLCTAAGPRETARAMAAERISRRYARTPKRAPYDCLQVPVAHKGVPVLTPGLIEYAKQIGVQVHVWTIDDPAEMNRLLDLGVDGVMTDRPRVLRAVLTERGQWPAVGSAPA
ncbi:MAG: glycerophosphodiester phosphodiesterase [Microthrixaceae bacterium]